MALSKRSVKKAYDVLREIGVKNIPNYPLDASRFDCEERMNPEEHTVYGWDEKQDGGWENLYFLVKDPTEEFKEKFMSLAKKIRNSAMSHIYEPNKDFWIFGWY